MKEINEFIEKKNQQRSQGHEAPPNNKFYASQALMCPRQVYFSRVIPKELPVETLKVFHLGHILHEEIQKMVPGQDEVPLLINEENIIISGRIDKVHSDGTIIEFKTTSNKKFNEEKPSEAHVAQLMLYLKAFDKKSGKIVYVDKRDLSTVEHTIEYDPEIYNETISRFKEINLALETNETPKLSEDLQESLLKNKYPCSYCQYKDECKKHEKEVKHNG